MSSDRNQHALCKFAELADPGTYEFSIGSEPWPLRGFVVRRAGQLRAYVNRCPHAGHMLNLLPNRFFTPQNDLLLCSSHGALFDPQSGECVAGPCVGKALQSLEVAVIDDWVVVRHRGGNSR